MREGLAPGASTCARLLVAGRARWRGPFSPLPAHQTSSPPHCRVALRYFDAAPGPWEYVQQPAGGDAGDEQPAGWAAQLARCTLRGLQLAPELRARWGRLSRTLPGLLQHPVPDVRWCAAECAALLYCMGEASKAQVCARVLSEEERLACQLRWQNERAMFAAEAATMFSTRSAAEQAGEGEAMAVDVDPPAPAAGASSGGSSRKRKHGSLGGEGTSDGEGAGGSGGRGLGMAAAAGYVEVCGLELPLRRRQQQLHDEQAGGGGAQQPLVHTPTVATNLEAIALGLCLGSPIMVEGPPGSGKTAAIEHLAALTGNAAGMARLHLDDQLDSKSLLGAYVCGSRPGEFVWQPGPLTQVRRRCGGLGGAGAGSASEGCGRARWPWMSESKQAYV